MMASLSDFGAVCTPDPSFATHVVLDAEQRVVRVCLPRQQKRDALKADDLSPTASAALFDYVSRLMDMDDVVVIVSGALSALDPSLWRWCTLVSRADDTVLKIKRFEAKPFDEGSAATKSSERKGRSSRRPVSSSGAVSVGLSGEFNECGWTAARMRDFNSYLSARSAVLQWDAAHRPEHEAAARSVGWGHIATAAEPVANDPQPSSSSGGGSASLPDSSEYDNDLVPEAGDAQQAAAATSSATAALASVNSNAQQQRGRVDPRLAFPDLHLPSPVELSSSSSASSSSSSAAASPPAASPASEFHPSALSPQPWVVASLDPSSCSPPGPPLMFPLPLPTGGVELINVRTTVLYHIDGPFPRDYPELQSDLQTHFRLPTLPGGDACALRFLPPEGRPFMGPNLYTTAAGPFSWWHQDGHGGVDSGHQCITGLNEVWMLRRMGEEGKVAAMKILHKDFSGSGSSDSEGPSNGSSSSSSSSSSSGSFSSSTAASFTPAWADGPPLHELPSGQSPPSDAGLRSRAHDEGQTVPPWPTARHISELRAADMVPCHLLLYPGDLLHIGKSRLHAFRKLSLDSPVAQWFIGRWADAAWLQTVAKRLGYNPLLAAGAVPRSDADSGNSSSSNSGASSSDVSGFPLAAMAPPSPPCIWSSSQCVSIAWDWMYSGWSPAAVTREIMTALNAAERNRQYAVAGLGLPETVTQAAASACLAALQALGYGDAPAAAAVISAGNALSLSSLPNRPLVFQLTSPPPHPTSSSAGSASSASDLAAGNSASAVGSSSSSHSDDREPASDAIGRFEWRYSWPFAAVPLLRRVLQRTQGPATTTVFVSSSSSAAATISAGAGASSIASASSSSSSSAAAGASSDVTGSSAFDYTRDCKQAATKGADETAAKRLARMRAVASQPVVDAAVPEDRAMIEPHAVHGFSCHVCKAEISNAYMHCFGCEVLRAADYNVCMRCFAAGRHLVNEKVDKSDGNTATASGKSISSEFHKPEHKADRIGIPGKQCSCKQRSCISCKSCVACACACHTVFQPHFRFRSLDQSYSLLGRLEAAAGQLLQQVAPALVEAAASSAGGSGGIENAQGGAQLGMSASCSSSSFLPMPYMLPPLSMASSLPPPSLPLLLPPPPSSLPSGSVPALMMSIAPPPVMSSSSSSLTTVGLSSGFDAPASSPLDEASSAAAAAAPLSSNSSASAGMRLAPPFPLQSGPLPNGMWLNMQQRQMLLSYLVGSIDLLQGIPFPHSPPPPPHLLPPPDPRSDTMPWTLAPMPLSAAAATAAAAASPAATANGLSFLPPGVAGRPAMASAGQPYGYGINGALTSTAVPAYAALSGTSTVKRSRMGGPSKGVAARRSGSGSGKRGRKKGAAAFSSPSSPAGARSRSDRTAAVAAAAAIACSAAASSLVDDDFDTDDEVGREGWGTDDERGEEGEEEEEGEDWNSSQQPAAKRRAAAASSSSAPKQQLAGDFGGDDGGNDSDVLVVEAVSSQHASAAPKAVSVPPRPLDLSDIDDDDDDDDAAGDAADGAGGDSAPAASATGPSPSMVAPSDVPAAAVVSTTVIAAGEAPSSSL